MTYQTHKQSELAKDSRVSWKYRIAYGFFAWVLVASMNNALGLLIFVGLICLYPFAMSFLAANRVSFLANERSYLKEQWKILPVWQKAMGFAALFALSPFSVGVHFVSDFLSLTFVFCLIGYPMSYVLGQVKKSVSQAKDQL